MVHISVYVLTPCTQFCLAAYVGLCAFDYICINANINTIYVTPELNVWTTVSLVPDILHFMLFNDTSGNNSTYVYIFLVHDSGKHYSLQQAHCVNVWTCFLVSGCLLMP